MEFLILILKKTEYINDLNEELKNIGIHHGTIVDAKSMTNALSDWDDAPMFGLLRRANHFEYNEECKMLMFVLKENQIEPAKKVIEDVIGDLSKPGTAVMFTLPISFAEGLGD